MPESDARSVPLTLEFSNKGRRKTQGRCIARAGLTSAGVPQPLLPLCCAAVHCGGVDEGRDQVLVLPGH